MEVPIESGSRTRLVLLVGTLSPAAVAVPVTAVAVLFTLPAEHPWWVPATVAVGVLAGVVGAARIANRLAWVHISRRVAAAATAESFTDDVEFTFEVLSWSSEFHLDMLGFGRSASAMQASLGVRSHRVTVNVLRAVLNSLVRASWTESEPRAWVAVLRHRDSTIPAPLSAGDLGRVLRLARAPRCVDALWHASSFSTIPATTGDRDWDWNIRMERVDAVLEVFDAHGAEVTEIAAGLAESGSWSPGDLVSAATLIAAC